MFYYFHHFACYMPHWPNKYIWIYSLCHNVSHHKDDHISDLANLVYRNIALFRVSMLHYSDNYRLVHNPDQRCQLDTPDYNLYPEIPVYRNIFLFYILEIDRKIIKNYRK